MRFEQQIQTLKPDIIFRFWQKVDIEMDGKMLNSHGVDFLDGPLGLDLDEKDLDEEETRRDMAKILKELKQKHPDKEVGSKVSLKKRILWFLFWINFT